jgi:hypothetical protein
VCAHLLPELPALFYDVRLKNRLEFPERKSVKMASCWLARTHKQAAFLRMECVIAYAGCVKGTREELGLEDDNSKEILALRSHNSSLTRSESCS